MDSIRVHLAICFNKSSVQQFFFSFYLLFNFQVTINYKVNNEGTSDSGSYLIAVI